MNRAYFRNVRAVTFRNVRAATVWKFLTKLPIIIKHLDSCYFFTPVVIETSGVLGPKTTEFLKELGHRLRQVSGEANSFAYLTQRLSVAIQRGNAASVLGTIKMDSQERGRVFLYKNCCIV